MADDILALLEDGPKALGQLADWLHCSEVTVVNCLLALAAVGQVKRVSSTEWALRTDAAPVYVEPRQSRDDGLEVAWSPHRDAPSLTGEAAGLGSTLAGGEFMVRR